MKSINAFFPIALLGSISTGSMANIPPQQYGFYEQAKSLLAKVVAEMQEDRNAAFAKFDDPNGGFKDQDRFVFCTDQQTGRAESGPLKGKDTREQMDPTGKEWGKEMLLKAREGKINTVDYIFPKPGAIDPVPVKSFFQGIGLYFCGVAYYK